MNQSTVSLAAAALALTLAGAARADDVTFTGFAHGAETVTFTVPSNTVPSPATVSGTVSAGGFATLSGGASFESYCVDLYQTISFGAAYNDYTSVGSGHVFANVNAYGDLSRLFATAGPVLDAVHEAAFQLAVWEIAYETGGAYGLGSGVATFTASAGATSLATSFLANLGSGSAPGINVLNSPTHQDVIFAPVPEPSTYLLMVMGLLGMVTVAKRRGLIAIPGL